MPLAPAISLQHQEAVRLSVLAHQPGGKPCSHLLGASCNQRAEGKALPHL